MAIEIVDFPIKHGDFPWQNVGSPEGMFFLGISHDGSGWCWYMQANITGVFLQGIHGTSYIAAPWIHHGYGGEFMVGCFYDSGFDGKNMPKNETKGRVFHGLTPICRVPMLFTGLGWSKNWYPMNDASYSESIILSHTYQIDPLRSIQKRKIHNIHSMVSVHGSKGDDQQNTYLVIDKSVVTCYNML